MYKEGRIAYGVPEFALVVNLVPVVALYDKCKKKCNVEPTINKDKAANECHAYTKLSILLSVKKGVEVEVVNIAVKR